MKSGSIYFLVFMMSGVLATGLPAAETTSESKESYARARSRYYALLENEKKKRYRHHWLNTIAAFRKVWRTYPQSVEAPKALFTAGKLWRSLHRISGRATDLDRAVLAFEEAARGHPQNSLADDAWWEIAVIENHRGRQKEAKQALLFLLDRYQDGDMVDKGKKLIQTLDHITLPQQPAVPWTEHSQIVGAEAQHAKAKISELEVFEDAENIRILIPTRVPVRAKSGQLPAEDGKGGRVYVDLERTFVSSPTAQKAQKESLLTRLRTAQHTAETVRVVVEVRAKNFSHRLFAMANPHRIVVEITAKPSPSFDHTQPLKTDGKPRLLSKTLKRPGQPRSPRFHVVLDPGHGGKDTGALGCAGTVEKNIVLQIAKKAATILQDKGISASLTRNDDTYVGLERRTAIANELNADVFVSIHANAHKNKKARGIETYYLDVTDDKYSLRLAAVENKTSDDQVSELQLILADISTKSHTESSVAIAQAVQEELIKKTRAQNPDTRNLGVKGSLFYVLLGARMPAVLVETSFLTHPKECKLLTRDSYQLALADAIAAGAQNHLKKHGLPPLSGNSSVR